MPNRRFTFTALAAFGCTFLACSERSVPPADAMTRSRASLARTIEPSTRVAPAEALGGLTTLNAGDVGGPNTVPQGRAPLPRTFPSAHPTTHSSRTRPDSGAVRAGRSHATPADRSAVAPRRTRFVVPLMDGEAGLETSWRTRQALAAGGGSVSSMPGAMATFTAPADIGLTQIEAALGRAGFKIGRLEITERDDVTEWVIECDQMTEV